MNNQNHIICRKTAFTLIELVIVIAIIALLMGLLFPAFAGAFNKAKIARTISLIERIEGALTRYNSDYRDYPPSTAGGGGTIDDNAALLQALISKTGLNAPYEEFSDKETASINGKICIVDAWYKPLLYTHFTDYDPNWETNQAWRFEKKTFEFQLVSPGTLWDTLDADKSGLVENSELNGLNGKQINKIIKNW